jgi:pyruvate kinase
MKKTKIIATIGPSSENLETLRAMIKNGLNVVRINMSHAYYEECDNRINLVRQLNEELGTYTGILVDTKGPELRTGSFINGEVQLKKGTLVKVHNNDVPCEDDSICVKYPNIYEELNKDNVILLNNGLIKLTVVDKQDGNLICRVDNDGTIKNKRTVNLPGIKFTTPFMSEKDREDIIYAIKNDVDFLALSFVSSKEDVLEVRRILEEHNNNHIQLISKIENEYAVKNIDEILEVSDGIMVARGDLGVEFDMEKLPSLQKELSHKCYLAGKICIIATEMLASMENSLRPTRAEVSDVANAVFDGADAIMLSAESAVGLYPVETVSIMSKIAENAEQNLNMYELFVKESNCGKKDISETIAYAVKESADILDAKTIVVGSMSGFSAKKISHYRPNTSIITLTPNEETYRKLCLNYGIYTVLTDVNNNLDEYIVNAKNIASNKCNLVKNDILIIVGGLPMGVSKTTNLIKIEEI